MTGWFALAGTAVAAVATVGYLRDILFGKTRPHRISWGLWCLIGILGFSAADAGGAGPAKLVIGFLLVTQIGVFLLSLSRRFGKPGGQRYDPLLGIAVITTLVVWKTLSLATWFAALVAVAADAVAAWPTLREAWRQPETEATWPWAAGTISMYLGVAAVRHRSFSALAYPVYLALANTTIVGALMIRHAIAQGDRRADCSLSPNFGAPLSRTSPEEKKPTPERPR